MSKSLVRSLATAIVACLAVCATLVRCDGGLAAQRGYSGVIIVVIDTVRADHCSLFGHASETTPALRSLAATGRAYSKCWSPSPWTAPSHASLFTGLLPDRHNLRRSVSQHLQVDFDTLAERMKAGGYVTGGFSANANVSAMTGLEQGFDVFELHFGEGRGPDPHASRHPFAPAGEMVDRTLEWVATQRAAGRPHFAFVNVFDAHLPYDPPGDAADGFLRPGTPPEVEQWARDVEYPYPAGYCLGQVRADQRSLETLAGLYDAEVALVDRAIGRLVDGLDALGATEDTLIVVLSDHGENLGDHGLMDHLMSVHASLLHVPLVIRAPGVLDDGQISDRLVRIEDIGPTVLELCGLPPFNESDGVSILATDAPRHSHAWLDPMTDTQIGEIHRAYGPIDVMPANRFRRSVFDGRFHLILESQLPPRLYDLANDPGEIVDVATRHPEVLETLRRAMEQRSPETKTTPR